MRATGTFVVKMSAEPPFESADGVVLAHARFDKQFSGGLEATSSAHAVMVNTAVPGSAAYVAAERIVGTLDGRRGSFAVTHRGLMDRGAQSLSVTIVADSGTGELAGINGTIEIRIAEGVHHYAVDYELTSEFRHGIQ